MPPDRTIPSNEEPHSPNNTFSTGFSITRPFRESGIKESTLKLLQKAGEIAAQEQKVEIRNLANSLP
ncbi:hypothetical protein [Microcystis aeruginosa]|uniref:Uncharacterized protein n=1 Tax=Microcystis aeruginosa 11-30S32 TaxID=2358142 RepID=A0A510PM08_MICAE|nr:hypothetical protein [Microcystis aeruginosa]GCA94761.1 hypothetical protein MAE30S32_34130 [Microcystis aeruginosa 11-30S32]